MERVFVDVILPALIRGGAEAFREAKAGDQAARRRLIDIVGPEGRLDVEKALDEAMIADLPSGSDR